MKAAVVAAVAGLLVLALVPVATAHDRDVQTYDFTSVGTPVCADDSVLVEITGTWIATYSLTQDATGSYHGTSQFRMVDATAVDLATGEVYKVIGSGHQSYSTDTAGTTHLTAIDNALIVGPGRLQNTNVHLETAFVYDAEGNFRILVDGSHVSCGG